MARPRGAAQADAVPGEALQRTPQARMGFHYRIGGVNAARQGAARRGKAQRTTGQHWHNPGNQADGRRHLRT